MRARLAPVREVRLAAKLGFLTKDIWNEFIANGGQRWRNKCWVQLQERGIFRKHPSSIANDVLVLNSRNSFVRASLSRPISPAPFVAQLTHDTIVARSALRLVRAGIVTGFLTENELKQLDENLRQSVIGRTSKYADALLSLKVPSGVQRVALELELTRKDPARYRECVRRYKLAKDIERVIFIARSDGIFESLKRAVHSEGYSPFERPIGFVHLDEWLKDPAEAPVLFGTKHRSLRGLTQEACA